LQDIEFEDSEFKSLLEKLIKSSSISVLKLTCISLESRTKEELFESFLASSKTIKQLHLSDNSIKSLEIFKFLHLNKCLEKIYLLKQNYLADQDREQ